MLGRASKVASLALALGMTVSMFAGCSKTEKTDQGQTKTSTTATAATSSTATQSTAPVYPLKGNPTIKYWMPIASNWSGYAKNFAETEIGKELEKRTGVKVEYIHPAQGQDKEVFNILVASGDLPDIIEYKWTDFPGGPSAAINNSVIIKLNDTINKYSPNLKKYLAGHPEYDKEVKMDDGSYYFYPFLRDGKELIYTSGPIIRKDWLDELKLSTPETMDDWYNMLKAFKEKKGAAIPLTAIGDKNSIQARMLFENGYNARGDFFPENGKIKYGYIEPGNKELIIFMNKLYQEGLLDKNFASTDRKAQDSNFLNDKSGATYGAGGGNMGTYITTMKDKQTSYKLTGAAFPVVKKGDKTSAFNGPTGYVDRNVQAAITTKCKNIEAAAKLLDYGYSKEGNLLYNFGTEGVSYTMKNGIPTYTDLIMKNPDKLTVAQAMSKYSRGNVNGPFAQDPQYILQFYELQDQKDALKMWSDHSKIDSRTPLITPTDAESADTAKIMNDVNTYVQEMQLKFIMGTEPIANYDKYLDQMKKMGIEKAIAMKQAAYDRFNKR